MPPSLVHTLLSRPLGLLALLTAGTMVASSVQAQVLSGLRQARIKDHADGILSLMAYSVVPDLASSNLSIKNGATENPSVFMTQLGGGDTISKSIPVYLEGAIAYSRYDPTFIASAGGETRTFPTRWNSITGTGGIGYDFHITDEWVIRPIFDFSLGKVASDLRVAQAFLNYRTDLDLDFLDGGTLNAYGLGGAVMLDWEHIRTNYQIDLELRYTDIRLRTFGNTSAAVEGEASARTANVYFRYRAPTGFYSMGRPLRYVTEYSYSRYMGSQAEVLGFNQLSTVGLGLELDTSKYNPFYVSRLRLVARYVFGNNVEGVSLGLAASF
ncbi:hypothetical protein QTH91_15615 [Variovorax dokdonensis]|uniref:Autotransporter domain-containing protein n=1 Tax=Variovorax dokdonensis TaxID=344883 RepID=A0ABT7ND81_9BURK|nr:hypothetical protein [Variovorax dokdonensis]MDM0045916.1 hypothetical protein [Variovorax dokdonensis]